MCGRRVWCHMPFCATLTSTTTSCQYFVKISQVSSRKSSFCKMNYSQADYGLKMTIRPPGKILCLSFFIRISAYRRLSQSLSLSSSSRNEVLDSVNQQNSAPKLQTTSVWLQRQQKIKKVKVLFQLFVKRASARCWRRCMFRAIRNRNSGYTV